ncbi:MAG TPA: hypothetical protein VMD51_00675, partial [Mycobacterium sp.]|nr:hypothetical protein [Mycobacterium sp.]
TGSVNVTSNGVIVSSTVTLSVVNSAILVPQPGSLFFDFNTGDPTPQPQSVNMVASDGSTVTATATTTTSWLTVSQTAGSTAFSVTANPGNMAAGMYTGTVIITQSNLTNSPVTLPVVLIINGGSSGGGGGGGSFTATPSTLTFNAAFGAASPGGQNVTVSGTNGTSFSVSTATQNGGSWLIAGQGGGVIGSAGTTVTIFVNSTTLALGTYNGSVTFTANGASQVVSVVLNVTTSGTGGGNISTDKTSLAFSGQAGSSNLAAQTVNVTSTTGSSVAFTASASTTSGGSWLSVTASNTSTPSVLTVTATIGALGAGTYNGSIVVAPTGGSAVTIPVSLTVSAPPTVSASPTSLSFSYRAGDATPATQNLSVTGGSGLTFTATASSNGNWLNVTPATGSTPATLTVGVSPSSLSASNTPYTGTITVSGTGSAGGSTTITVSLTVTAPLPTVSKVTNAGSFATSTSVSPGEIVTLFASDANHPIGPSTPAGLTLDSSGKVATTLSGVQVLAAGYPCPLIYVSASQISAVVPYEVASLALSGADILVKYLGQSSNAVHVNVATTQPGLFTLNSSGTGPGAILNSNGTVNSPSNPAAKGDVVVIYMTGEGQTTPAGVTGKVTTAGGPPQYTPAPLLLVSILVGGQPANYIYAGEAPGFVAGVMQLNVVLPATIASGDQQIIVSVGPNSSQAGVTVSVR